MLPCHLCGRVPGTGSVAEGFCGSGLGLEGGTHVVLRPRGVLTNHPVRLHPSEHRWAFSRGAPTTSWPGPHLVETQSVGSGATQLGPKCQALWEDQGRGQRDTPQRSSGGWLLRPHLCCQPLPVCNRGSGAPWGLEWEERGARGEALSPERASP